MIIAEHLTRVYQMEDRSLSALTDVSFHVRAGEYAAIVGPSGSGKSTLMHILGCLDRPDSGRWLLGGQDVSALDDRALCRIRGEQIGFVFQGCELIPRLTALENVALPLLLCGTDKPRRIARAEMLLTRVGLGDRLHHRPSQLSGGQRQRVAIARALVRDPPILLADEPTGALDPASAREVLALLDTLHHEGRTILLITHDPGVAGRTNRQLVMQQGRLAADISTKNVQKR